MSSKIDYLPVTKCFNITTGKLNSNAAIENGKYPFFTCAKELFYIDTYAFDQEALLLAGNNAKGQYDVKHYSGKFDAYQRTYVLTLANPKHSYNFFKYALQAQLERLKENSKGTNTKYITIEILERTLLPIPPPNEQKRIATILDKADGIRLKRHQALKLADDFVRSVFLNMFGDTVTNPKQWDEYVLKDITDIRSGVTKGKKINLDESLTLPYMRVANVQDGYLDLSEVKNIVVSPKDAEKCLLKKGDVLLTEGGDPDKLGRGYIWNNEVEQCLHQNHIFSVRIKDQSFVKPEFLSALISSPRGKRYFLKVGKQTTGIATINKTVLSEFVTFIPPIELQQKYIDIKNKIDKQKLNFNKGDLNLFNSLSQKAFSGNL